MVTLAVVVGFVELLALILVLRECGKDSSYWTMGRMIAGTMPYIAGLILAIWVVKNAIFTG